MYAEFEVRSAIGERYTVVRFEAGLMVWCEPTLWQPGAVEPIEGPHLQFERTGDYGLSQVHRELFGYG
jgi:hypothetical protein